MKKLITLVAPFVCGLALASPEKIIEFRQGDKIPFTAMIKGDLAESLDTAPTYIGIKKNFFLKMRDEGTYVSWDGVNYKPFHEMVHGSAALGTTGDVASAITLAVEAYVKP